ncbi:DNA-directed RNA polymerase subunit omega [Alkalihalobacillus alcalophilus ATCC 27647 = CGMCC 1.3604]|uniref:DNA-directed RNA polymerase subunit omega n=1 Tax=Alkalihalobacillus alcalophilus ATCC 27647 = CGMCC 1.3604 TaxID=1218173 RepID=A0A094XG71_ALKAL|nr:DNA-directed RNA polymerase subunit omega [Alkalihalobacillus alcalophilus]KGA97745.1 DNA-directed RNA polymerase subunit omega [Alkalihalobacillus alcalophilus ATCC 27647 = CGMCC 1.3604]MED1563148.1 DNA-directed RNA polymerase subunit omega [Alkalihalobacillus alcalophilus]THG91821.1 DNA-directed RNA polymerase subunit omega [Alkalihalobacillus alcalophilus ATCC 27647 = CGMCC 1.3604]
MLYPSIDSLMDKLDSKYTLVTVSAKRAREMKEDVARGPLVEKPHSYKPVGLALEEIVEEHLRYERVESLDEQE